MYIIPAVSVGSMVDGDFANGGIHCGLLLPMEVHLVLLPLSFAALMTP